MCKPVCTCIDFQSALPFLLIMGTLSICLVLGQVVLLGNFLSLCGFSVPIRKSSFSILLHLPLQSAKGSSDISNPAFFLNKKILLHQEEYAYSGTSCLFQCTYSWQAHFCFLLFSLIVDFCISEGSGISEGSCSPRIHVISQFHLHSFTCLETN